MQLQSKIYIYVEINEHTYPKKWRLYQQIHGIHSKLSKQITSKRCKNLNGWILCSIQGDVSMYISCYDTVILLQI